MATTVSLTAEVVADRLRTLYPTATYELNWETPLQLLVASILAAQCTDERVNAVTPELFRKYPNARAFAKAKPEELAEAIASISFFRIKATAIRDACQKIMDQFGGEVPRTVEELITLPRVARKTANIILNVAYGIPSGIIVDGHAFRVCTRMGLTTRKKPEQTEKDLTDVLPQSKWINFGSAMVLHGRYTCRSADPACESCSFRDLCPQVGVETSTTDSAPQPLETKTVAKPKSTTTPAKSPKKTTKSATPTPDLFTESEAAVESGSHLPPGFPESWRGPLADQFTQPYFQKLQKFVAGERATQQVFPPEADVFNAFKYTPFEEVRVLLLGQDPYHDDGQAHGLCFSVLPGVAAPPSLKNMFKELQSDLGCTIPNHGCLEEWAKQGMLLLNTVLTVRAHQAASHKDQGWELFTDAVIRAVSAKKESVIFVLWGSHAQKKTKLIDASRHTIIATAHPSPLSAHNGFFGSKPYSKINAALKASGNPEIRWQLPNV